MKTLFSSSKSLTADSIKLNMKHQNKKQTTSAKVISLFLTSVLNSAVKIYFLIVKNTICVVIQKKVLSFISVGKYLVNYNSFKIYNIKIIRSYFKFIKYALLLFVKVVNSASTTFPYSP